MKGLQKLDSQQKLRQHEDNNKKEKKSVLPDGDGQKTHKPIITHTRTHTHTKKKKKTCIEGRKANC